MPRFLSNRTRTTSALALLLAVAIGASWAARTAATAGKPVPSKAQTAGRGVSADAAQRSARQAYGRMPLSFEANQGQTDPQVKYLAHGPGYNLFLTPDEAVLVLQSSPSPQSNAPQEAEAQTEGLNNHERRRAAVANTAVGAARAATVLRMQLLGANPHPTAIRGDSELPGKVNYLFGNDAAQWRTNVPTYGEVRYEQVYPGVDMVYYGNQQQLEYDFVVAPGADAGVINLNYAGAQSVRPDGAGGLTLKTAGGDLRQHKPVIYQEEKDGTRKEVAGHYVLKGDGQVGFKISKYDRRKPLIIDPVLSYLSFVNAGGNGFAIAVDQSGFAYITGAITIGGSVFDLPPTPGAFQTVSGGGQDVFVTKINQAGNGVVYSTFLGGSGDEDAYGIAIDGPGNAYVTGYASPGFPTTPGAYKPTLAIGFDAFVTKLNPTGSGLVYSTYFGGLNYEECDGITVDAAGNAYVAGITESTDLPTTAGAVQTTNGGGADAFVAEFNATGSNLLYATYIGGGGFDYGLSLALDSANNVYFAGQTGSLDLPSALQPPSGTDRGLFKSTSGGGTWVLSRNGLTTGFINALAVAPNSASTVYAGTQGGVSKSTDNGVNWAPTGTLSGGNVVALAVDPTNANVVYTGSPYGVFKTTNGGSSWSAVNNGLMLTGDPGPASVRALAIDRNTPTTIYAAANGSMFKSTNGGGSWTQINTGLTSFGMRAVVIDPSNSATIYALSSTRVHKSTNGGANWTQITTGLPSVNTYRTLAIDPLSPATLYVGGGVGVYKTTNGGTNWSAVNNNLLLPYTDNVGRLPFVVTLAVDPVTPTTLYVGANNGGAIATGAFPLTAVLKSTDSGANWTAVTSGFNNLNTSVNALVIDPTNPATIYAGTFGDTEAYVLKLTPGNPTPLFSNYLGGSRADAVFGVKLDSFDNPYFVGRTNSANFPVTAGAYQTTLRGVSDAFIVKLNAANNTPVFATYLGGSGTEDGHGIALDQAGNIYVAGRTTSADFPVTVGAFQTKIGNPSDATKSDVFVTKLNPAGNALSYSSYLGGAGDEAVSPFNLQLLNNIGLDAFGNAYVVGITSDNGTFPAFGLANAFGGGIGSSGTFVAKIAANAASFSITGHLTTTGALPIANQSVEATDASGRTIRTGRTDSSGYYELISLLPGDYIITPDKFGAAGEFNFAPVSRTFNGLNSDQTADFVGTPLYTIGGQVKDQATGLGVVGVTVTLSGSASGTSVTRFDGQYQFNSLTSGGTYTVTPAKAGYTFNPVSQTFPNLSTNTGINFITPSAHFYTVSGQVVDGSAVGVGGVAISLSESNDATFVAPATTNASGNYSIPNVQSDLTYFVVALKPRLTFTPYIPTIGNLAGPTTVNLTAAAATGLNGKIAYTQANQPAPNGTSLYVANADGTNATNINNDLSFSEHPSWSPDGTKLAFDSDRGDPINFTSDIFTINADGTGLVRVTNTASSEVAPAWSTDGAKIAYNTDCSSADLTPVDIYTINPDGSGRKQLTNTQVVDGLPGWSPDATKLTFTRTADSDCSGSEAHIWTMNADGSGQTQLTTGTSNLDINSVWSPDGTKIAFARETNNLREQLYVMNADGTGVTNLTPFIENVFRITWSPDSTKLAFEAQGPIGGLILVINANGTGLTQISDPTQASFDPDWQPDQTLQPANIGGQIVDTNGVAISGATVSLSGTQSGSTTTDANGFYSFRNITRNGNYTVTPTLVGRVFSPVQQSINNLLGTRAANFSSAALTVSVSGRVLDANNPTAGLSGVTVTLSGSAGGTTTTDVNGNYSFTGLAFGGNYTVTPARTNYEFESPAQTFSNVQSNRTADFMATLVFVISGRVTDGATGAGVSNVTITVSGTRTVVTTTDQTGNYAVTIAAGGTYSVTATSPYNVFTPPRADFPNLSAPQTANFVTLPTATPTPTPPLSDNFNTPVRDPEKWNLGTVSQDPAAVDPLIPVVQRAGHLEITPRPNVGGEHYNGYVSVRPFDLSGGTAGVEAVQTTTSNAETIFGLGSDSQNNYRFVVTSVGNASASVKAQLARSGYHWILTETGALVLVFQVRVGGVVTQEVIPYDPTAHRFWRVRHDAPVNAILFETSPDNSAFTERYRKVLDKSVSALAVELTAGTATPTAGGGTAIFDNLNISTSSMEFSAATFTAPENVTGATLTVTRTGNVAGPATVDYTTVDNPANVRCDDTVNNHGSSYARCDYATSVDTLTFAPGETQKSFRIPIIDDVFVEGDETIRVILRNPTGAGLDAGIGAATLTIIDNDTTLNAPNPVFTSPFFIRQQYLDFLSREPDAGGFNAYLNLLNNCQDVNNIDPNAPSAACDRITVSAAFFGSPEFKLKGFYVFNFYQVAFNGQLPAYADIIPDMRAVTGRTSADTFQKRAAFATNFSRRQAFRDLYDAKSDTEYVAALLARYNLTQITTPDPANPEGTQTMTLTANQMSSQLTAQTLTRAQVLRAIVQSSEVSNAEFNRAFVAMQYYGYLRRKPETGGYNAWLNYLRDHPDDFRTMVNGFMNSTEYRIRFGAGQ
ncbi:MAG: carboxypeptidase regulatory-like domain-containing protein [Pyrinomonadaceae bacterium]